MTTYIKKDFASPNGPILLLSAKGSTTTSIAQANGVKDFSGNENHGTAYGNVAVLDGGEGFSFDRGTNSYILGHNISVSSPMTFCFRLKISSTDSGLEHAVFDTRVSSKGILFGIMANGVMMASQRTPTAWYVITDSNVFPYDRENFVVVVFDSDKTLFYLDGVLVKEASEYVTLQENQPLNIGKYSGRNDLNLKGYLKDIRIYPRALSAAEVKYLCNGFQPNIIVGQTIPSGAILDLSARGLTTAGIAQANGVVDRSGNGNHGQAYNGVAVVNDDEMGSCFSLVNVSGNSNLQYCQFDLTDTNVFSVRNEITITTTILFRKEQLNFICGCGTTGNVGLWLLVSIGSANSSVVNFNAGNLGQQEFTLLDLVLNKFYVITVTLNSNKELSLFINGTFISSKTLSGDISTCGNPIRVGNITTPGGTVGARLLDGEIESLKIYPRALTASEVQQLADASLKKITNIKSGSSDVRQIFSNGEMIYAKTNDYSLNL